MKQSIIPESEHEVARAESPFDTDETTAQEAGDQARVQMLSRSEIQFRFGGEPTTEDVHGAARDGIQEAPRALPHGDAIQRSFGHHSIGGVKAHVGGRAADASEAMGAEAFATGSDVGFKTTPDLHTAAHEAAHVVQQRGGVQLAGGVGASGDHYEQHADAVADRVVSGGSAEAMLDGVAAAGGSATGAVQRKDPPPRPTSKPWLKPPAIGTGVTKPPRPKSPKPARPKRKHPPLLKNKKKLAQGSQKPKLPPKPMTPVVEEEPLEEITPEGIILTPVLVDGKWEMIEEEPLEEIPPEPEEREEKKAKKEVSEEVKKDEEATKSSETTEVKAKTEEKVAEEGVSNAEAKERIQKGATAIGGVAGNVSASKPEPEPEQTVAPQAPTTSGGGIFSGIKKFFKGIGKMFSSKSSAEEEPLSLPPSVVQPSAPRKNPAEAASDLGKLKTRLEEKVPVIDKAETAGTPVAKTILPAAKADCDQTAQKIAPNAAQRWVTQVIDIGVGIGLGFQAMATHVLAHGGIEFEDLTLGEQIGAGGSGAKVREVTYLGMAPMAHKLRARKDYEEEEDDPIAKEAKFLGKFSHKNILGSGGRTDRGATGTGYTMEKAEHGDLKGLFKKMHAEGSGLSGEDRMLIMRYLMRGGYRGLAELHKKGLIHADIKHENFLLGGDLETKLMDFDKVEAEETDTETGEVKPGTLKVGTGAFMAPEVVDKGVMQKSDIWSMGETLLFGVFDMDSVDIKAREKTPANKKFGWENKRARMGGDKAWFPQLEAKVDTLKGSAQFKDFVKKTMTWDPKNRMNAIECLQHNFLKLTDNDVSEAQKLLKKLLG